MQLYGGGQNLLAQRESTAGTVAGENQSFYSNPALSLVTAPSNAPQMGASMAGTGQTISSTAGPWSYPTSDLESLMNMVYNATSATNIGQANAQGGRRNRDDRGRWRHGEQAITAPRYYDDPECAQLSAPGDAGAWTGRRGRLAAAGAICLA